MSYLLIMIEDARQKMIEMSKKHGLTSNQAVECSQHLDELLNQLTDEKPKKLI